MRNVHQARPGVILTKRSSVLFMLLLAGALARPSGASTQSSAEQQLADKYAPVVLLKEQASACDKAGEGYFPSTVELIFDNPAWTGADVRDGAPHPVQA